MLVAKPKGRATRDLSVFFTGHGGLNGGRVRHQHGALSGMLPRKALEAFGRSEDLLDLEIAPESDLAPAVEDPDGVPVHAPGIAPGSDPAPEQNRNAQSRTERHSELGPMLEMLRRLGAYKITGPLPYSKGRPACETDWPLLRPMAARCRRAGWRSGGRSVRR